MVVLVFMTSCQVSLNLKIGPMTAQATMIIKAATKETGCPVAREVHRAKRMKGELWYNLGDLLLNELHALRTDSRNKVPGRVRLESYAHFEGMPKAL